MWVYDCLNLAGKQGCLNKSSVWIMYSPWSYSNASFRKWKLFKGWQNFSIRQVMKSWAGPGNKAKSLQDRTRWMHDIVGWAWVSAHVECGPVARTWLSLECNWTSGHRISHKKYTSLQHRNSESGIAKAFCTQAGPAHAAGHVEMAWTDESHLFGACATGSPHRGSQKRSESSDRNRESGNEDKQHWQIDVVYLCHSRHWIG